MDNVNLTIRIPPDLLDQLRERAKQEDRTLASMVRVALTQFVQTPPAAAIMDPAQWKAWQESQR